MHIGQRAQTVIVGGLVALYLGAVGALLSSDAAQPCRWPGGNADHAIGRLSESNGDYAGAARWYAAASRDVHGCRSASGMSTEVRWTVRAATSYVQSWAIAVLLTVRDQVDVLRSTAGQQQRELRIAASRADLAERINDAVASVSQAVAEAGK